MDTPILNINEWYIKYQKNPIQAKLELVLIANKEILKAMDKNYYSINDLKQPNYSEICEWCGFPDFQDGGIFETIIDTAINLAANLNDYKAIQLKLTRTKSPSTNGRNTYRYKEAVSST